MLIDRDTLCSLIPHAGRMCLLDSVLRWDDNEILCESGSHLAPGNPLRHDGRLASVHLVEYGAQAIAVHGSLMARQRGDRIIAGYLVALRDLDLQREYLDGIDAHLQIHAQKLAAVEGNYLYNFEVSAEQQILASGRATVAARTEHAA